MPFVQIAIVNVVNVLNISLIMKMKLKQRRITIAPISIITSHFKSLNTTNDIVISRQKSRLCFGNRKICDGFKLVFWILFLTFNIGWYFGCITFNTQLPLLLSTNSLVVRFTTINAIGAHQHYIGEFDSDTRRGVLDTH